MRPSSFSKFYRSTWMYLFLRWRVQRLSLEHTLEFPISHLCFTTIFSQVWNGVAWGGRALLVSGGNQAKGQNPLQGDQRERLCSWESQDEQATRTQAQSFKDWEPSVWWERQRAIIRAPSAVAAEDCPSPAQWFQGPLLWQG